MAGAGGGRRPWLPVGIVLMLLLVVSGAHVVAKSHEMRNLFTALTVNQAEQDRLLTEYSRLLLERGTLSSYQNVDRLAEDALSMRFPDDVERVQR